MHRHHPLAFATEGNLVNSRKVAFERGAIQSRFFCRNDQRGLGGVAEDRGRGGGAIQLCVVA